MLTSDSFDALKNKQSVLTIGSFDGVHIGHQKIIKHLVSVAHKKGLQSVVLTFFPHPRMVLNSNDDIKLLNTLEEKSKLLESFGVDHLIVLPFTKEFSNQSASDYVKHVLVDGLRVAHLVVGYDHHFGKNREANVDNLITYGSKYHFEVEQIDAQDVELITVSSSKIRKAIESGKVSLASQYLGYYYHLKGTVVHGKAIGRQIGFPTANIQLESHLKLVPKNGVYAIRTLFCGVNYDGMMNIGNNPTVSGQGVNIEVHFFDFDRDLYGQTIEIDCIARLRDEHKFDSLEALAMQLIDDKTTALKMLKK